MKFTKEHKRRMSEAKRGENNPMWRGNKVGYFALHDWVRRNFPKPKLCECCKKVPPYDLANKGIYDRNLENWEWICRRCHMKKDGRLSNFLKESSKRDQSGDKHPNWKGGKSNSYLYKRRKEKLNA